MLDRTPSPSRSRGERDGRRRSPCVDTERVQNPRSASLSATQRSPRIPVHPAMTAPLAGRRELYIGDIPQRRLTITVGFRRLVVGTPARSASLSTRATLRTPSATGRPALSAKFCSDPPQTP
jgi:hypothetical protein